MKNKGEKNKHSLFDILFSSFSFLENEETKKKEAFMPLFLRNFESSFAASNRKSSFLNKNEMAEQYCAYRLDKEAVSPEEKKCFSKKNSMKTSDSFDVFEEELTYLSVSGKLKIENLKTQLLKAFSLSGKGIDNSVENIDVLRNARRKETQLKSELTKGSLPLKHADLKSEIANFSSKNIKEIKKESQKRNRNRHAVNLFGEDRKLLDKNGAEKTVVLKNPSENKKGKVKQIVLHKRAVNHDKRTITNAVRTFKKPSEIDLKYSRNLFKEESKINKKTSGHQTIPSSQLTLNAIPVLDKGFGVRNQVELVKQNRKEKMEVNFRRIVSFKNEKGNNKKDENLAIGFEKVSINEIQKRGGSNSDSTPIENLRANKVVFRIDSKLIKGIESAKGEDSLTETMFFTRNDQSGEKRSLVINAKKFGKRPFSKRDKRFKVVSHKGHFDLTFSEDKTLPSKVKPDLIDSKEVQVSGMSVSPWRDSFHKGSLSHDNVLQLPVVFQKPLHNGSNTDRDFPYAAKGQQNQAANSGMKYALTATFEDMKVRASMVRKFLNISIELPQAVFNTAGLSDEVREILSNTNLSGFRLKIKSRGKNLYSETFYKEEESSSVEIRV
ncbi:hypothetical protein [Desulfurobacterium sp.]